MSRDLTQQARNLVRKGNVIQLRNSEKAVKYMQKPKSMKVYPGKFYEF